jgi:Spy/CpxP family protein refolding chaperone
MKRMRIAALGVAIMAFASVAGAQAPPASDSAKVRDRGEMRGERGSRGARRGPMGALFKGITLSDAQQSQVRTIAEKYRAEMKTLRAGHERGTRPDSASVRQMRAVVERQQVELRGVLTADQQKQFDQNVTAMRERMQERAGRKEARGARRGAR